MVSWNPGTASSPPINEQYPGIEHRRLGKFYFFYDGEFPFL